MRSLKLKSSFNEGLVFYFFLSVVLSSIFPETVSASGTGFQPIQNIIDRGIKNWENIFSTGAKKEPSAGRSGLPLMQEQEQYFNREQGYLYLSWAITKLPYRVQLQHDTEGNNPHPKKTWNVDSEGGEKNFGNGNGVDGCFKLLFKSPNNLLPEGAYSLTMVDGNNQQQLSISIQMINGQTLQKISSENKREEEKKFDLVTYNHFMEQKSNCLEVKEEVQNAVK